MKKVCHITSVHSRYDGRIFLRECRYLSKAGYNVALLVGDTKGEEKKDGVTILSVPCATGRFKRILTSSWRMYYPALKVGADIYHIHDPELLLLAERLHKKGKHVIYDSHEFYYYQIKDKEYLPKIIRGIIASGYRLYEKRVLSKIDAVVTPCTIDGKNYFEGLAKHTVFIDNRPERNFIKAIEYSKKQLPMKCCYVGSLSVTRGLKEILEATISTHTDLILAGALDSQLKETFGEKLSAETVDYRDYVDREGVQKIYDEAHIGISLIHNTMQYGRIDNLPTKVYEYMLAGIPVILSRRTFSEQFLEKYPIGILVDPENLQEIEDAICYLKEHIGEARGMGEIGNRAVREELCWEIEAEKLIALYKRIID